MTIEIKHKTFANDSYHYVSEFWIDLPSGDSLYFWTMEHCWWDRSEECQKEAEEHKVKLAARLQELKGLL